jgi:hypothetical protein
VFISSGVDSTAILDGFTVIGGNADGESYGDNIGGGIHNDSGSPSLSNMIFSDNSADSGGGLYNYDGTPSLTNVTFSGNTADYGGGMYNGVGSPTLTNVAFNDNSASYGGGMHKHDVGSPSLTNVTFNRNTAEQGGGGMSSFGGSPSLTNVTFYDNSAFEGGGMYTLHGSPDLMSITFNGNEAEYGGGMYNHESSPSLTNVIFSGNTANWGGGGIANYLSNISLTNVTVSGNKSTFEGGGMHNRDDNPTITNTILWGNTAGVSDSQIYNEGAMPSIQYSDVQGGCAAILGNDCSGGGNIDADPLFVRDPSPGPDGAWGTGDDDYGDLHLIYRSPAIDAGDSTTPGLMGITTDLDGQTRFHDVPGIADTGVGPAPVVDMGAFEKQNESPSASNDNYKTNIDAPLHRGAPGILANDVDLDGDSLSAVLESEPSSGSLALNPDGSFDYQPEKDFSGMATFTYHATDGELNSNSATVTITVTNKSDVYLPMINRYVVGSCPPLNQDDFSNPGSGWPIVSESDFRLEYLNGKYRIWLDYKDGSVIARPDFLAADYALSVDLQNVSGVYGSYGLIFGLSDDWSQFYSFDIDPQGNYSIFLYDNGDWSTLGEGFSTAIHQGSTTNHLKIVRNGSLIEAWANGNLLSSISNNAYTGQRYVGLIASTFDERNLDVHFDNFLVEPLSCGAGTVTADENLSLTKNLEKVEQFIRSPINLIEK